MLGKINYKNGRWHGNIIGIIGVISVIIFLAGCAQPETELQFGRRILNALCAGNQGVDGSIDWENFQAMGTDLGQVYSHLTTEKGRRDYRKLFLNGFAYVFKTGGVNPSIFTNWRVQSIAGKNTIVATDTPSGKVLLLTLSDKDNKPKLIAINWRE